MVERITDPHQPVTVHGIGRLADGDTVPQPPAPPLPDRRLRNTVLVCAVIVLALFAVGFVQKVLAQ